jgi:predicted phage terminase large subunit-like protein
MLDAYEEAFYGGAAGGGKSDALLMAALQYIDQPGYAAILFRKTYADLILPGALMDRAREWLGGTDAQWKESEKTYHFPSEATLTFGYLDNDADVYRYQSSEFQFVGFDELTQFKEFQYRYLFSRVRRLKTADVPLRMRAASNPGNIGHDWVKQRFLIEGADKGRPFIRATLQDNPFLDQESYIKGLENLDPTTRQQLLNGNWDARADGGKFKREWFKLDEAAPNNARYVRYWDMAATEKNSKNDPDWTAGCLLGKTPEGMYFIKDVRHRRGTPQQIEALITQTAQLDGPKVTVYMEQEPGASGKSLIDYYTRQVLGGFTFYGDKPQADKTTRADPVSSQAEAGNIHIVQGTWINDFLDELESFPNGSHDDQVDALSGAFAQLNAQRMYGFSFPGETKWESETL